MAKPCLKKYSISDVERSTVQNIKVKKEKGWRRVAKAREANQISRTKIPGGRGCMDIWRNLQQLLLSDHRQALA